MFNWNPHKTKRKNDEGKFSRWILLSMVGLIVALSVVILNNPEPTRTDTAYDYYQQGILTLLAEDYEAARDLFTRSIELKPDFVYAYNDRGIAYYELGNFDAALADYNRAIQLEPDFAFPYNNRGYVYAAMGNYED